MWSQLAPDLLSSVGKRIGPDLPPPFRACLTVGVDPRPVGIQAAPAGPVAQPIHRLGGGDRHGHDVVGRLGQRHIQQRRQTAATADLRSRPVLGLGLGLIGLKIEQVQADLPDRVLLRGTGQIQEEHPVKPLGPRKFRWQLADVIARADDKHIRATVVQPGQERAEQPGRDTAVGRPRVAHPAERLFNLVDHQDAR